MLTVQHNNYFDSENQGSYSIKHYTSKKTYNEAGDWQHEQIILKPLNPNYNPIVINEDDGFMVIGEFVGVVE